MITGTGGREALWLGEDILKGVKKAFKHGGLIVVEGM